MLEKLDFIDSKFRLAILVAKRAKQIVKGSKKRIHHESENPLSIAIEEVYSGKINYKIIDRSALDFINDDFGSDDADSAAILADDFASEEAVADMKGLLLGETIEENRAKEEKEEKKED
ncbi:MAG: DNA-directed RNA polymerase subunit omega [bacterium]|nr:DNA-directed RNA polymerase subunit omega [bacterium]